MGTLREAPPAKLFLAIMHRPEYDPGALLTLLAGRYGALELRSSSHPFGSGYYEREMGSGLLKFLVAFRELIPQERLARVKREAVDLELELSDERGRVCNLDPGIVSHYSVVLATTKGYAHRVYLGGGIYAEPELLFRSGRPEALPWTYPDYREAAALDFFREVRRLLLRQSAGNDLPPA